MSLANLQRALADVANPPPATISSAAPKLSSGLQNIEQYQKEAKQSLGAEVNRIVDMPIIDGISAADKDLVDRHYVRPEEYAKGYRLFDEQALALVAYYDLLGLIAPIPVGGGKTLTTLNIANDHLEIVVAEHAQGNLSQSPRALLIIPSPIVPQLRDTDVAYARKHTRFDMSVHFLAGASKGRRAQLAQSGRRGLYVMSYSLLSCSDGYELLEWLAPSLIICDEAHRVSGRRPSARAKRFRKYVDRHAPKCAFLSGTLTAKSPMDYSYLASVALRQHNFLPNSPTLAEGWCELIDSEAASVGMMRNDMRPNAGPITPLLKWARKHYPKEEIPESLVGFRHAFSLRMRSSPGVVAASNADKPWALIIENQEVKDYKSVPGWDRVHQLVKDLEQEKKTPSGELLEEAMLVWQWRYELEGGGFYNELYWPKVEDLARRKRIGVDEATDLLEDSKFQHMNHVEYQKDLRKWLKYRAKPGMDTPFLVGGNMHAYGNRDVGKELYASWMVWKNSCLEGNIERDSRAVRVCPFKVDACADFVVKFRKKNPKEGLIIWAFHNELGQWALEKIRERGITDACICGAGDNTKIKAACARGDIIVASFCHAEGKNLQAIGTSYYLQWPRPAILAEQSLGRTHRNGQLRDEVNVVTNLTTPFDRASFAATLNDAVYRTQTMGVRDRLIMASYNPPPRYVSRLVMDAMDMEPDLLDKKGQEMLEEMTVKV